MMRFLTSDLRRNLIKVACLSIGLAIGFLLIAKIYFEMSHDSLYKDSDRIFKIGESIVRDGDYQEWTQTPGAIAPGLKRYVPQVESATRITRFLDQTDIVFDTDQTLKTRGIVMADSSFFDTFGVRILQGDAREAFSVPNMCAVPRSLAEKIKGDPVGMEFTVGALRDDSYRVRIAAVYEDFPVNASLKNVVYLSLPTIGKFSFDGRDNWMGNDRYLSYVRLSPGAGADDMKPHIRKMLEENIPADVLATLHFDLPVTPLSENALKDSGIRTMVWIMAVLAVMMLMVAALNYLLIVIGQMGKRSREMAVRKCYGTSASGIFGRVMGESLFFLGVSMGLALLLVFCFPDLCNRLLGATPGELFTTGSVWVWEGAVIAVLIVLTGVVPAWMYCRTPVAHSFRESGKHRRGWKLALLAVQFFSCGLLLCLLSLVVRQYARFWDTDLGIETENVAMAAVWNLKKPEVRAIVGELKELPEVQSVATADHEFLYGASGNNINTEGGDMEKERNVADLYDADPSVFETLGIEFTEGGPFREVTDSLTNEVIVEERMRDIFRDVFELDSEKLVGQRLTITEHTMNPYTIVGVVKNMRRGGFTEEYADKRPAVMFRGNGTCHLLYVRFKQMTPEALKKAQEVISKNVEDVYLTPCSETVAAFTQEVKNLGTSIVIVSVAILLIALIGLVSYTADEVRNRSKEIAIRKVNGTDASKIIRMFCKDVLVVALPSLLAGGALAIVIGRKWLSQFTDKVSLGVWVMAACLVLLASLVAAVVVLNTRRVANSNPVYHLRNE